MPLPKVPPAAAGAGTPAPPARRRGHVFRRYAVICVALVSGALLTSGLAQAYFSYQDTRSALGRIQQEQAASAAYKIAQFLAQIAPPIRAANQTLRISVSGLPAGVVAPEQRREEYARLLRQLAPVTDLRYLDAAGKEEVFVSRVARDAVSSGVDHAGDEAFRRARSGQVYYGPVTFRGESEPYLTLALPDEPPGTGVTVAEVNLKFIWDVVSQTPIGEAGIAYVVDGRGRLVAHPDISLVLQQTDLSSLAQVHGARAAPAPSGSAPPGPTGLAAPAASTARSARDRQGRPVLTAHARVDPPGWFVFVEQPESEALAPLDAALLRTAGLLVVGLGLSVLASLALAQRMVVPIRALQAGAARIGAGALDQHITVRTGDELETLAEEFNRMAARLRESYGTLEEKVEERTRDLALAMRELDEKSRQLAVASQHKSEFLATMSHELRTPLNAIIGFSEVLLERFFGDLNDKQEEYLNDILASGRHLLSLINDILDLSKVEAGRMELEPSRFPLAPLLESGLVMVRERASRGGVQLELDVDPEVGEIEADERKVKQVLFNLLSNAVKFTPPGGRVDVRARPAGTEVEIAVRDTGVGIATEDQGRIFEEFRQARAGKGASEGTGLGLALTQRLVELHGGRIGVESAPDQGSTFTVTLPRRQPAGV